MSLPLNGTAKNGLQRWRHKTLRQSVSLWRGSEKNKRNTTTISNDPMSTIESESDNAETILNEDDGTYALNHNNNNQIESRTCHAIVNEQRCLIYI